MLLSLILSLVLLVICYTAYESFIGKIISIDENLHSSNDKQALVGILRLDLMFFLFIENIFYIICYALIRYFSLEIYHGLAYFSFLTIFSLFQLFIILSLFQSNVANQKHPFSIIYTCIVLLNIALMIIFKSQTINF